MVLAGTDLDEAGLLGGKDGNASREQDEEQFLHEDLPRRSR